MEIILATEIWGRTPHIDALAGRLRPHADRVTVADPFDGRDPHFATEEQAYAAYLDHGGLEPYARRVTDLVREAARPVLLIGFSAGAGAAWAAACTPGVPLRRACCFYGSAIRTMADRAPLAPVDLIFPDREPHFDVDALAAALRAKPLVTCRRADAGHGFMNPLSENYDEAAGRRWTAWLVRLAEASSRA
ncbi:dienelactone hydrolase family protein [Pseudodesulfovibrio methanolicus]|uniref:Dienelactone hydrolase family protein n=1 Tax=Pseudodesulfovibrio methanolicus TaxID=3126690 RepID=A0ABZ2IWZ3_9BACT